MKKVLQTEVARFREFALRQVHDFAAGPDFARLAIGWYGWIEGKAWMRHDRPVDRLLETRHVGDFAHVRLQKMRRRLRKAGRQAMSGPMDDWHVARIAAKKLRYAGGPLLAIANEDASGGEANGATAKRLMKLQDALGQFNDLCNVGPFLRTVRAKVPPSRQLAFAEITAFCDGWAQAEARHAVPRIEKTWQRFESAMEGRS